MRTRKAVIDREIDETESMREECMKAKREMLRESRVRERRRR